MRATEVSVAASLHEVAIAVCDRGPDIPADRLGDVFEAFTGWRNRATRRPGSIALGPALTRAIVCEARGEVTLEKPRRRRAGRADRAAALIGRKPEV